MEEQIQKLIRQYKEMYDYIYEDRKIGESSFSNSDMEYLDTIEMMISDLEELLNPNLY